MNDKWYFQEKLAYQQHAELLKEAERARLAKSVEDDSRRDSVLHRLINWLGKLPRPHLRADWGGRKAHGLHAAG